MPIHLIRHSLPSVSANRCDDLAAGGQVIPIRVQLRLTLASPIPSLAAHDCRHRLNVRF